VGIHGTRGIDVGVPAQVIAPHQLVVVVVVVEM